MTINELFSNSNTISVILKNSVAQEIYDAVMLYRIISLYLINERVCIQYHLSKLLNLIFKI